MSSPLTPNSSCLAQVPDPSQAWHVLHKARLPCRCSPLALHAPDLSSSDFLFPELGTSSDISCWFIQSLSSSFSCSLFKCLLLLNVKAGVGHLYNQTQTAQLRGPSSVSEQHSGCCLSTFSPLNCDLLEDRGKNQCLNEGLVGGQGEPCLLIYNPPQIVP